LTESGAAPPVDRDRQFEVAVKYAKNERGDHTRAELGHRAAFYFFQTLTIVAAAVATSLAVADPSDVGAVARSTPAAIATLSASVLAAFGFRGALQRHLTAKRNLEYEILKFENHLREYRPTKPRPEKDGVDLFLDRVSTISRAGHQEPEQELGAAEQPRQGLE
jgi:hypothetical protein